jgi:hypothetical protein
MTTPVFPLDNVFHGIAKPAETEMDVLLWKKMCPLQNLQGEDAL